MRLFVGIPVPASPQYEHVAKRLPANSRPVPAGTWHVTLRFLGEMLDPTPVEAAMTQAVRHRQPIPAVIEGLGAFPNAKQARVAWAGVRAPGIEALAHAIVERTRRLGEAPESRRFVAHATLARFARPVDLRSLVHEHQSTLFAAGNLDRVVLYRSAPGPAGQTYTPLRTWMLGDPSADASEPRAGPRDGKPTP